MSYKKQVRPVNPSDTNQLRDLLRTLEIDCFTIDIQMGIKHLGLNGYPVFVLEVKSLGIKGLIIASIHYSIFQSPTCKVDNLFIDPEFVDLDNIAMILEPIEKFCIEKKISRVQVNLQERNKEIIQEPLHRLGFSDSGWNSHFQKNIPLPDDGTVPEEGLH